MITDLLQLILTCERSGGAVGPVAVLALCRACRAWAGLASDMALIIHDRVAPPGSVLDDLSDRMADARTVLVPTPEQGEAS